MGSDILVGATSLLVAVMLLLVALPNKSGASPRFLRFEVAQLIYPTLILAILAFGAANLLAAF